MNVLLGSYQRYSALPKLIYRLPLSLYTRMFSHFLSYDNDGTTRDEIKERFCLTMEFVENYLMSVVSQNIPFDDREKNKLTFEVGFSGNITKCQPERMYHMGNYLTSVFTFLC